MPELYSDPVYLRGSRWTLSTSAIWSRHFPVYGWGEVNSDFLEHKTSQKFSEFDRLFLMGSALPI